MKTRALLVMNAGSSSIKFCVYYLSGHSSTGDVPAGDRLEAGLRGQIEGIGTARPHLSVRENGNRRERALSSAEAGTPQAATALLAEAVAGYSADLEVVAVGHRIVHGGMRYSAPVQLDATVLDYLDTLNPLAPLHQPHNLAVVRAIAQELPDAQQIGCFDTAFHQGHDTVTEMFALPYAMYEAGVRRYGFHGLSYEYIAGALPDLAPTIAGKRVIAAHLGNGASLCAINGGRSVDSTMGFSALDGLPMGTRCGQLDPGVILYLLRERGMTAGDLEALFYKQSGLLGISGISADMRDLLASEEPRAQLAIDYFVFHIAREIAALTATLGGLDALVFTAGIGEHSPAIRERVCARLGWLGVNLDTEANQAGSGCISAAASAVSAWVLPTNEELMIARHTQQLLAL